MTDPIKLEVFALDTPRPGLRILARDPTGLKGAGEGFPLPQRGGEDPAAARAEVSALALEGPPLELARQAHRSLGEAFPVATFALESALLDLASRQAETPIWNLLRGTDEDPPLPPINALLPAFTEPTLLLQLAREQITAGHATLKLKLGVDDFERDLHRLRALRKVIGPGVGLRVDANEAWSLDEAPERMAALAPLDLEYVEQPVPAADLPRLAPTPVAVAADESLGRPELIEALLENRRASVWVLKPGMIGILRTLVLATRARAEGIEVVITHAADGPLALDRARAVARALSPFRYACGLA